MSYAAQAKSLAAYNRWANERILGTTEALSGEGSASDCADGRSIEDTLAHAVGTHSWWLNNWTGTEQPSFEEARTRLRETGLRQAFSDTHDRIAALLDATDDERWATMIAFTFPGASVLKLPMWQTFAQVMLHGVQHRAQVAEALTRLGHSPGDLDYILWLLRHGGA